MTRGPYMARFRRKQAQAVALESSPPAGRVRHIHGFRKEHAPPEVIRLDPADIDAAIDPIRIRIRRHQRAGFKSYLFIDDELRVYVISDMQSIVATWLREHGDWFVGVYAGQRVAGPDALPEDIAEHIRTRGP